MKIIKVQTFLVEGSKYNWTLVKVEIDSGLHGWGESTKWPTFRLVDCQHVGQIILGHDAA